MFSHVYFNIMQQCSSIPLDAYKLNAIYYILFAQTSLNKTHKIFLYSNEASYFSIYKIINPKVDNKSSNKKYLDKDLREVANSGTYLYQREVSKRFELPADEYVIIPSLFKMNVKMKFVLRMYIETSLADVKITELNKNFKKKPQIQEIIYSDPKPIPKESEVNDSGTGPVSNESEIIEPGPALASEENKIDVVKFFFLLFNQ